MRAIVIDKPRSIASADIPEPELVAGEVIVRVDAAGICAGDLYIYQGKNPYAVYPVIGGHEIAGTVADAGDSEWRLGERVVIEPFIGCGECYPCRVGKPNCCANLRIIGVHRPGGYADLVSAPSDRLHAIPEGLSAAHASLAEPVAIALQACRRANVSAGEYALVLGCGPIGLALIEVARARGARVVAVDVQEDRLAVAAQLGAETLPAGPSLRDAVLAQTCGEGAPVVLEATGNAQVIESCVDLVASGGRIAILGLVRQGVGVTFPGLDITRKELTILGSRASTDCFPEALQMLAAGHIHYAQFATELSLNDAPAIFAELDRNPAHLQKGIFVL